MEHSIDFFRDEVRNGFYIPTAIKQAWAASLDVLSQIDLVCEKHGIKYFADWGTFLGAVRHGGYVPWDDDLDICMLRDDYIRFREVADRELPEEFVIHDYERKEDHWLFLARVVNNSKMCFEKEYLDKHNNFPWLAGVDIFVKDYLYADDEAEKQRDSEVMKIIALADGIVQGSLSEQAVAASTDELEEKYSVNLSNCSSERDMAVTLYRLAEQQMARVKPEDTDRVGQIFPWVLKNGAVAGEKKELYEKVIRLPFEDTTIPVPAAYNTVLARRYGNYCEIRKVWDGHAYPYFEAQKADIEQISGEKFDRFKYDREMLERPLPDKSNSLKTIAEECLKELKTLLDEADNILLNISGFISAEDVQSIAEKREQDIPAENVCDERGVSLPEEFIRIISDSQQLAADLGTLVEQVKGEERDCTKRVTEALQGYCDALWTEYQELEHGYEGAETNGILVKSREALERVSDRIKKDILDRKEILFLPIGGKEWKDLKPCLDKIYANDINCLEAGIASASGTDDIKPDSGNNTDIYVVPLPLLRKTVLGDIRMSDEEIREAVHLEDYPDDISGVCVDWTAYDLSLHCPDVVYIQNPYDETNPLLTVPPAFYASNIRKYADRLIYVPAFRTGEFGADDMTDQYNLKHYVTAPGIIYSDEVIVWSDNIKEQYVNALTLFAGEDTKDVWSKRIKVNKDQSDNIITDAEQSKEKGKAKRILYCIGANELTEHEDIFARAVNDRLSIFAEAGESIRMTIVLYPGERSIWKAVNERLSERLFKVLDEGVSTDKYEIITFKPGEADDLAGYYDAYYGCPSPLVPAFVTGKKPVMISNYNV